MGFLANFKNLAVSGATKLTHTVSVNKPEIALAAGIVLVVGAAVAAAVCTSKAEEVVTEHQIETEQIVLAAEEEHVTPEEEKKAIIFRYGKTVIQLAKVYLPAILSLALGVSLILYSHGIMRGRNAALLASYNALDRSYREYKARVEEEVGPEKEKEIRFDKKGQEKSKEKGLIRNSKISPYEYIFDEFFCDFQRQGTIQADARSNYAHLITIRNLFNSKLRRGNSGWVGLDEVLNDLGYLIDDPHPLLGWYYDKDDPRYCNTYIDFGLPYSNIGELDGLTFNERAVYLTFNCSQFKA